MRAGCIQRSMRRSLGACAPRRRVTVTVVTVRDRSCSWRVRARASPNDDPPVGPELGPAWDMLLLAEQSLVMFCAGAVLGPFCDGLHSSSDVLHYANPTIRHLGPLPLETCWWVPLMFGVAGLILGVSYPVLDAIQVRQLQRGRQQPDQAPGPTPTPSWGTVLLCISLFVMQYKLSAVLEVALLAHPGLTDAVLCACGLGLWRALDGTPQGLAMSCLTAVAGPALEVALINGLGLYTYSHAQVLGVPTWIPWVYFAGGPAVGLLGRRVWATLAERQRSSE